jgi:methylphosphotriester-DNA--protein-cysteine methyltransferase
VLVILGQSRSPDALHAALDVVRHRTVSDALRRRLADAPDLAPLATRALREAVQLLPHERTVPALARALLLTDRTLRRQLECAAPGLTPQRVLGWATLLHMAWYLEASSQWSFDRLAAHLDASSPANWRRLLRKLTGLAPSTLRTSAVDSVVAAWVEQRGRAVPLADTKA